MKKFNDKAGFTLIEIIVVLIIVGILAAIALPNFYSNVNKSKSQEAFAQFEQYKTAMELCLNMNIGNEATCKSGGGAKLAVSVPNATANITYTESPPAATPVPGSNGTGISAAVPGLKAYLTSSGTGSYITLTRRSNGTWGDVCSGAFSGVC